MRNEKGFTLVEMLIVLLIISVLILVTVPNVTKHFQTIDAKGCDAYIAMVQSQVEAYKIDHHKYPSFDDLKNGGYLPATKKAESSENGTEEENSASTATRAVDECPNGKALEITTDGEVEIKTNAE